jgi:hypothetical protein
MSERLDEMGWGDTPDRGWSHRVIGDLLCVGTGVTMASLWAASCLACFFLPNHRPDDAADSALGHGTSRR